MSHKANTYKRIYFQNAELYREVDSNDDLILERYTLHVSDGQNKVAQLDTQTGNSTMYRYQYGNNLGSVGLELSAILKTTLLILNDSNYGNRLFRINNDFNRFELGFRNPCFFGNCGIRH